MVAGIFFTYLLLTLLAADGVQSASASRVSTAKARVFLTGIANVSGVLTLTETSDQPGVNFVGQVTGLTPGNHGFHVHQFGDVFTDGCNSTGAHYNPNSVFHGARELDKQSRHAGDEGNIVADNNGIANIDFVDSLVSLIPNSRTRNNIVGRSLVVHALEDDLGWVEMHLTIWDLPNRDGISPQISPIRDLRLHSSYIVNAHEVLRKGLQEFLVFKNETLETYLHYFIYHRTEPLVNEYSKTIRSYKKVLRFIWQQYNETSVQNYAIKQYDRDKLDLCSVARFLSHQPTGKNRATIMKRMGEALDYQCHPCTPYRRKEHSDTITPSFDGISPEGISPDESRNLCERYQED